MDGKKNAQLSTINESDKKVVSMSTNPWDHVADASEIKNTPDYETGHPEVMDDMISGAFNKYVSNDVNFGSDSFEVLVAEQDAFAAGWKAAVAFMAGIKGD
jgi:hypothetical protein